MSQKYRTVLSTVENRRHRVASPHCWGPALAEPDVIVSRHTAQALRIDGILVETISWIPGYGSASSRLADPRKFVVAANLESESLASL
jgi:hypothetical protein